MDKSRLKARRLRAVLREGDPAIEMAAAAKKTEPKCKGHEAAFVDYASPPRAEVAEAMCGGCPLIEQCRRLARDVKPTWGIWAGEVYLAQGKSKKSARSA